MRGYIETKNQPAAAKKLGMDWNDLRKDIHKYKPEIEEVKRRLNAGPAAK
jgi:hypothetical protein